MDLAVGVVIGGAFSAVIAAIVKGLITPLVAAIFGKTDLTGVGNFTINNAHFSLGLVLDALFTFFCVAVALYFVIVLPMNKLRSMRKARAGEAEQDATAEPDDVALLREIRDLLATGREGASRL